MVILKVGRGEQLAQVAKKTKRRNKKEQEDKKTKHKKTKDKEQTRRTKVIVGNVVFLFAILKLCGHWGEKSNFLYFCLFVFFVLLSFCLFVFLSFYWQY